MDIVMPGDRLSTEEEFLPSRNTYSENGQIYSLVVGRAKVNEGKMEVEPCGASIEKFHRHMYVVGEVVGELKSILFVKLDDIKIKDKTYIPSGKDGKILLPRDRPPNPRFRRDSRPQPHHEAEQKPCGLGDIILAKIAFVDEDTYALEVREEEGGVVYSRCPVCGGVMTLGQRHGELLCQNCKHREMKKVSPMYGNFAAIEKFIVDRIDSE
ncbi:MAG: hypothetical protein LVQ97_01115 [Candidatus Micrarchaeales archaeon]|uniref:RNA-binding protein (Consists of S1 domain and a Zn-ribbon domain) n=1 Tax=Candidatus Micrarchaeum acidiphilum ARMAN-2 TaxID=425595 RepID=C7DHU8_MICA2|nr:MAG: RNA-binding protein (consists of S1 domain and a Zn-ribbon domain) [Candidatus Micrarchaeum acidiphilum ARMAN-2]MCW6160770.1 hypothetical protein [Candidatus Micrarchaeales archaeon]